MELHILKTSVRGMHGVSLTQRLLMADVFRGAGDGARWERVVQGGSQQPSASS